MDAFWTSIISKAVVGAVAGGVGFLMLHLLSKLLKLKDATSKTIAGYGAVACAVIAVNLANPYLKQRSTDQAIENLDKTFTQEIDKAKATPPGDKNAAEILTHNMKKSAAESLSNAPDGVKKLGVASDQFLGFYLVNAKARSEFCDNLGIAIPSFVREFEKLNQRQLIAARKINASSNGPDEDKMYQLLKPTMTKAIAFGMGDQAKFYKLTEKEFCKAFEVNAKEFAGVLNFEVVAPAQSKVLMEANL